MICSVQRAPTGAPHAQSLSKCYNICICMCSRTTILEMTSKTIYYQITASDQTHRIPDIDAMEDDVVLVRDIIGMVAPPCHNGPSDAQAITDIISKQFETSHMSQLVNTCDTEVSNLWTRSVWRPSNVLYYQVESLSDGPCIHVRTSIDVRFPAIFHVLLPSHHKSLFLVAKRII